MADSRRVVSSQTEPHRDIEAVVEKHLATPWRRPIAAHTRRAFDALLPIMETAAELILDSCCGTGESTRRLAQQYPQALVVGVDKSVARLDRHGEIAANNYKLVRADVNDFWRLMAEQGIRPARHCLYYPNPYPKASQLRKRWHASPAFPAIIALGGELEVRSNWHVYIEEFACALNAAGFTSQVQEVDGGEAAVSLFEKKYRESGQRLWALTARLTP